MVNYSVHPKYIEIIPRSGKIPRSAFKAPLRALRLCILCIFVPVFLIAVPLYLRYHIYDEQFIPLGVSDMRLVDSSVSTIWCQKQIIRSNSTFNAYLLSDYPDTRPEPVNISMKRTLVLSNDMKEYWGFYLLKDSIVTISSCVRWPGASMIMIKGHKHLKECAYLGDNSSEELSEQMEDQESDNVSDANKPESMIKAQDGVKVSMNNVTINETYQNNGKVNIDDLPFTSKGKNIHLSFAEEARIKYLKRLRKEHHLAGFDTNNNKDDKDKFKAKNQTSSELFDDILSKLKKMGDKGTKILEHLNTELNNKTVEQDSQAVKDIKRKLASALKTPQSKDLSERTLSETSEKETKSNSELVKELNESDEIGADKETYEQKHDEVKLRHDRSRKKRFRSPELIERIRRDLDLIDGENENVAQETGIPLQKDGIGLKGTVRENTTNDNSKSEFWSSFSSSEERLMECEGLLLNLPLNPHRHCEPNHPHDDVLGSNVVSYQIPSNGYYFFIYNSENEVQTNYLKIHFELKKIIYNVSNADASCVNETSTCALPLNFFSRQKVVLELPYHSNNATLIDEYLAISTCEPRTSIYLVCVIAVPVLIVMFAFQ